MQAAYLFLAVFLLAPEGSLCHLCLISPPQRGSMMGINKPGELFLSFPPGGTRRIHMVMNFEWNSARFK